MAEQLQCLFAAKGLQHPLMPAWFQTAGQPMNLAVATPNPGAGPFRAHADL
jgi:hypothetical protein